MTTHYFQCTNTNSSHLIAHDFCYICRASFISLNFVYLMLGYFNFSSRLSDQKLNFDERMKALSQCHMKQKMSLFLIPQCTLQLFEVLTSAIAPLSLITFSKFLLKASFYIYFSMRLLLNPSTQNLSQASILALFQLSHY